MIFAKVLKLRDKLTSKRQKLTDDVEKPFLEHLEDLRKMLMKITITMICTLMITMFWYEDFFKIVKLPAKWAGLAIIEDSNRPQGFDHEHWERIKATARIVQSLTPPQRDAFFAQTAASDPKLRAEVEGLLIYHASWSFAQTLTPAGEKKEPKPEEIVQRDAFVTQAAGANQELLATVQDLIARGTKPDLDVAKPAIELVWRKPGESFFTAMKLAFYAGILLAFPAVFYFILEFVLPGLTGRERRLLWPALAIGFGLFLTGVCFAFFWVVPRTLTYFFGFGAEIEGTQNLWTFADYTSFVTVFSLIFGVSFELPVVVLMLVKLGLLGSDFMRRTRSWAIIIILVVAALITPTGDPVTLGALSLPMIVMYEFCIWIAVWMEKKAKAQEEADEKEARERHATYLLSLPEEERERLTKAPEPAPEPPQPVLHPEIQPYRHPHEDAYHDHDFHNQQYHDQHQADMDHDAWLIEQQEIYRKEHAHLFGETPASEPPTPPAETDPPSELPPPESPKND